MRSCTGNAGIHLIRALLSLAGALCPFTAWHRAQCTDMLKSFRTAYRALSGDPRCAVYSATRILTEDASLSAEEDLLKIISDPNATCVNRNRSAYEVAWLRRARPSGWESNPLLASCLTLNDAVVLCDTNIASNTHVHHASGTALPIIAVRDICSCTSTRADVVADISCPLESDVSQTWCPDHFAWSVLAASVSTMLCYLLQMPSRRGFR